jgi:transcriptional regulator with XRE-family HTH domain
MNIQKAIGKVIREHRLEKDLSQEDLADKTKLHRTYISSVERGKRNISIKNLERISSAIGISLSKLLEEAERNV